MHIALMEPLGISREELEARKAPFEAQGHVFAEYPRTGDPEVLVREAAPADGMILANMPMPAEVIRACPRLQFIDVAFTGVDHVGLEAARERGITVSNASGYADEAVAELALGMALSLLRQIPQADRRCREGGTKEGLPGSELRGKTVGIVGLGRIGSRSAELFHAFGCRMLATSRTVHRDCPAYITQVPLPQLLEESDIVALHCPLLDSTRGLIGREALAQMKPSALLLNLARGPVVDARALAQALNEGRIAGAGIDVFDREPPLDPGEPLLHARNTILTPHTGFASRESMLLRADIVFENLRCWLEGRPQNVVA